MARAPHIPDEVTVAKVEALVVAGVPQELIAKVIGIDAKTLRKHYHAEMEIALQKVIGNISNTLVQKAISGDTASIIFFLKARAGWSEKQILDHTSSDGSMSPAPALDTSKLSTAALAEIMAAADEAPDKG